MVGVSAAVVALAISGGEATAKPKANTDEAYVPTIWIDPDGCEHWAMDDGAEGYMDIRLDRNGKPICHRGQVCGVMPTDQLFATDKSAISASGRARLEEFFRKANARAYTVIGHTDSRSSDEYNMRLSRNRAEAVARVAKGVVPISFLCRGMANVSRVRRTRPRPEWPRTVVSKSSAFAKGLRQ
jgi:outer membrane protein OmpA-like peptidoglycan-associated protein